MCLRMKEIKREKVTHSSREEMKVGEAIKKPSRQTWDGKVFVSLKKA